MAEISNAEDIIDSRDVISRIEELENQDTRTHEEEVELDGLKKLAEQADDYCADWECGESLIRDSYFQTYAEELADDIGAIDRNAKWPLSCIDWERAARELQADYTAVDYGGVTYWVR